MSKIMTDMQIAEPAAGTSTRFSFSLPGISALILTLLINGIVCVTLFFGLIIAMNGFSGKDAEFGILLFIVIAALSAIVTAILSFLVCSFTQAKWKLNGVMAAIGSIFVFTIINGIISFAAIMIAVGIAEAFRKGGN